VLVLLLAAWSPKKGETTEDCNNTQYEWSYQNDPSCINAKNPSDPNQSPYYFYRNGEPILLIGLYDRSMLQMWGANGMGENSFGRRNGFYSQDFLNSLSEKGIGIYF
jgi:hypothetical protein